MRKWLILAAILFIITGILIIINSSVRGHRPATSAKPIEISSEAASISLTDTPLTSETALVKRVIDGDTIELTDGTRVRYIGIDTPEVVDPEKPVECYGREAREANKNLVEGRTVRMEKDISVADKYGRLLRYVYLDNIFVNEYLVSQGYARAADYPPDSKYAAKLRSAESEASVNKLGLWSFCPGETPSTKSN